MAAVVFFIYKMHTTKLIAENQQNSLHKRFISTSPFGNVLSEYFYYISQLCDNDALIHRSNISFTYDPDVRNFYESLNWRLKVDPVDYQSDPRATWNQVNMDGSLKPNFLKYWQNIRPVMREVFEATLPAIEVQYPVLHFRCSDSPFNKHNQYHMTKGSSIAWMAKQIKNRGYDRVTLLSCNQHRSLDQNSCQKYIDFYAEIFNNEGVSVEVQCNNIIQDFAMMVYSPILVTINASSFSFMAGISKDPHNYISCNMGIEINDRYYLQSEADWILDPQQPLLHKYVTDYNDTQDVINKLKNDNS